MEKFRLLCCHEAPHNGRVYFVKGNKRRWIPSGEHVTAYGFNWDLVETVTGNYISAYELSAPLPLPSIPYEPSTISISGMHEFIGNELGGKGIEFGASSSPFPIPITSEVEYADLYDHALSTSPYSTNVYSIQSEFVTCKYLTSIEKMYDIEDNSLDFIIACHVIEHVKNPLYAIKSAWTKLKPGGKLVLLVPHRDLTFDKNRDLTTLEHLILDYKRPLKERDFLHFVEFYEKAFVSSDPLEKALTEFNNPFHDIHYHTWNEETFLNMVTYFSENIRPWSHINHYSHLPDEAANEFYFILKK